MIDRVRQNWQYWEEAIDTNFILSRLDPSEVKKATIFSGQDTEYRKSRVKFLNDPEVQELLWWYVKRASFRMEIGVHNSAEIQYTEYHASEQGHYDWHHDVNWPEPNVLNGNFMDRKISITVQLSDPSEYEGGDFSFNEVQNPDPISVKKKGTVLCFPSLLQHRVSPVTEGVRKSMVAWFSGPTWR